MQTLLLILNPVSLLLFALWELFFKSYFSKKGENRATKEDIEDITRKTEKVRNDIKILNDKIKVAEDMLMSFFVLRGAIAYVRRPGIYDIEEENIPEIKIEKYKDVPRSREWLVILDRLTKINDEISNFMKLKLKAKIYFNDDLALQFDKMWKITEEIRSSAKMLLCSYNQKYEDKIYGLCENGKDEIGKEINNIAENIEKQLKPFIDNLKNCN